MCAGMRRKKVDQAHHLFLLQQSNHDEFKRTGSLRDGFWQQNKGATNWPRLDLQFG
jgi:hypothetical protein